jgi:hypothetical protein
MFFSSNSLNSCCLFVVLLFFPLHLSFPGFNLGSPRVLSQAFAEKSAAFQMETSKRKWKLPEKLIVGYANWNQCDDTIVRAVQQGVNVLIWFSINLAVDSQGNPTITNGPDMNCVAEKIKTIRELGFEDTIHLISIGGWNSPHPDTTNPSIEVYRAWNHWNRVLIANPALDFFGFDGFDWDIEGNDTPSSPYNEFTVGCLDLMGEFSQFAKQGERNRRRRREEKEE